MKWKNGKREERRKRRKGKKEEKRKRKKGKKEERKNKRKKGRIGKHRICFHFILRSTVYLLSDIYDDFS